MKRLAIIGGVLALVALGGFLLWKQYWYYLPGIVGNIQHPIADNRDIVWSQGPAEAQTGQRPPNIVVIVADDLGYNDISFNGGGVAGIVQTPNIDAIGRTGVVVDQGYASNATCSPSRAAIMTGRYPTRFGFEFTSAPPEPSPATFRIPTPTRCASRSSMRNASLTCRRAKRLACRRAKSRSPKCCRARAITPCSSASGTWAKCRPCGRKHKGFNESLGIMQGASMFLPPNDPNVVNARLDFDPIDRFLWANLQYAVDWHGADGDAHISPARLRHRLFRRRSRRTRSRPTATGRSSSI
jgi:hypothetical protein